jgi:hypothetical protein
MVFWIWIFALFLASIWGQRRFREHETALKYNRFIPVFAICFGLTPVTAGDFVWLWLSVPASIAMIPVMIHYHKKELADRTRR